MASQQAVVRPPPAAQAAGAGAEDASSSQMVVTPGETITCEQGFIRGHGTYVDADGQLVASVAGAVERVNKLVSVRPFQSRYVAEAGDVVVGRVVEVAPKLWRVDIGAAQDAQLQLSAVWLSGGAQRKRTLEDALQMRAVFAEDDLISAEVQPTMNSAGPSALQARTLRFGKLESGQLVVVPSALIQRLKHHFFSLRCGVDVVLGNNGWVWLSPSAGDEGGPGAAVGGVDVEVTEAEWRERKARLAERVVTREQRQQVAAVRNRIVELARENRMIGPESISAGV